MSVIACALIVGGSILVAAHKLEGAIGRFTTALLSIPANEADSGLKLVVDNTKGK